MGLVFVDRVLNGKGKMISGGKWLLGEFNPRISFNGKALGLYEEPPNAFLEGKKKKAPLFVRFGS